MDEPVELSPSPPMRSKRFDCPASRSFRRSCASPIARSTSASKAARLPSRASNPPDLIKHSSTRLFTDFPSTRSTKSVKLSKTPLLLLSSTIILPATSPTPFTAESPKRIEPRLSVFVSTGVKFSPDSFTSGPRTEIPISEHSPMKWANLSEFPSSQASTPAIKSTG